MALHGVERVFHQILDHPFEQSDIQVGLYGGYRQTVVGKSDVARNALAEIHDRLAHHLVDVVGRQHRLRPDLREAVDDLHQMGQILVHLVHDRGRDLLRAQILDPPQQRRGGRAQLVGRLLRQTDPHAVLLVLLGGLQCYIGKYQKYGYDAPLRVREPVQRAQQLRLAVKYDVALVARPHDAHRAGSILLGELVDLAFELVGILNDLVRDAVARHVIQILVGDDERDVVLRAHDGRYERIDQIVAERLAAHALHGGHPQLHVVLLLLLQHVGQLVGVEQRQHGQHHADREDRQPASEREFYFAREFHRPAADQLRSVSCSRRMRR